MEKKTRVPILNEAQEQVIIFEWAGLMSKKYPELHLMYHVPNGGSRHLLEAKNLKAQGVKSGVPDICLPVPKGVYHGLYIELKRNSKEAKTSDSQAWWIEALNHQGYLTYVAYGSQEAISLITRYLKLK